MSRWALALKLKGGHRYFREGSTGRIAVADYSGSTPEATEDGVLYLDTSKPIVLGEHCSIPLLRPDGGACTTGEWAHHAVRVATTFGMTIRADGDDFKIVPAIEK